jgi:uncharacterized protein
MLDGVLVVDATVHGFNFGIENAKEPFVGAIVEHLSRGDSRIGTALGTQMYDRTSEEFKGAFGHQPTLLEEALFVESQTDIACYHGVPLYGVFLDGSSPIWIGEKIAERFPHRMFVYADLAPTLPNALEYIDDVAARPATIGVKFYPVDLVDGRVRTVRMDMDDVMPLIQRCQDRGIKNIGVHKAVPFGGPLTRDLYDLADMRSAIEAFPDLTFEIVHGGFAFMEETAFLFGKYDNVTINLETNPMMAFMNAPKFADMMGGLLATGKHDKIFFATGTTGVHPRPVMEAFRDFQMPPSMPKLTDDMKAGIFGANFARHHGWNIADLTAKCAADQYGLERATLGHPWGPIHRARTAAAYAAPKAAIDAPMALGEAAGAGVGGA